MSAGILILGAGQAAAQLAISLRQGGYDGADPHGRRRALCAVSAAAAVQGVPEGKGLRSRRCCSAAKAIGPTTRCSLSSARRPPPSICARKQRRACSDGRSHDYDTLVFATGTRARDLPLPGIELPGVFSLRKIDDVRRLRPALDDARRIVIVGGGYIGLEVAAVLRQEGREAIVVEAEGRVMKRVAGAGDLRLLRHAAPLARRRHPARRAACRRSRATTARPA